MEKIRLRFAPSPTGALHIGGIRTALYNFLFARKHGGSFILRIEDTDQARYVPGAEEYITEALKWCGLVPDEGPGFGGPFGPYRQSERKEIYRRYVGQMLGSGHAYYAFDTPEELEARRGEEKEKGNHNFKYDAKVRMEMNNSLSLSPQEVQKRLQSGQPYTIRMKVPEDQEIEVEDLIRGKVVFQSEELDDKIILKGDGMPTYHMANVVDDYLMEISHVIRGEEWLPSTAHHVLLYRSLGWVDRMPRFAHLPLILRPTGQGKLSKRDGLKLGIPVFPLSWKGKTPEESFTGFREFGFDPRAVVNFLALLGWNPGSDQEIFSMEELMEAFSIEKIGKSGARFDFDKALWFNQQYIIYSDDDTLARAVRPIVESHGYHPDQKFLGRFCGLMKERVTLYPEFFEKGYYFFEPVREYDTKTIQKRWKPEREAFFVELAEKWEAIEHFEASAIQKQTEQMITEHGLKFGDVLPMLRIALAGTMQGPAIFEMMELLGKKEVKERLERALEVFGELAGEQ